MESHKAELDYEFLPYLRAYKDGHVERLLDTENVPPSIDQKTNVTSKDVLIIPDSNVSARLYLPKITDTHQKLPPLVYFHGGAFCISSFSTPRCHNYLNSLISKANVVVVSVDYRLAPEHFLPIAYEDSWAALKWVASHSKGQGTETWLTKYVDFDRVFLAGESAGANITHRGPCRWSQCKTSWYCSSLSLFFGGSEAIRPDRKAFSDRIWPFVCPSMPSNDDPRINPVAAGAPSLSSLGCRRVLVCVGEKDILRDRGWLYYETLGKCGWTGIVEITETEGEDHVFNLDNPTCQKAEDLIKRLAAFLNRETPPLL